MFNKQYPNEKDFDTEFSEFIYVAPSHKRSNVSLFSMKITRLVRHTCTGTRSVSGFVKIATALKNIEIHLEQYNINVSQLFITSLKGLDIWLQAERKEDREKKLVSPLTMRLFNLVCMIKGLLEDQVISKIKCISNFSAELLIDCEIKKRKPIKKIAWKSITRSEAMGLKNPPPPASPLYVKTSSNSKSRYKKPSSAIDCEGYYSSRKDDKGKCDKRSSNDSNKKKSSSNDSCKKKKHDDDDKKKNTSSDNNSKKFFSSNDKTKKKNSEKNKRSTCSDDQTRYALYHQPSTISTNVIKATSRREIDVVNRCRGETSSGLLPCAYCLQQQRKNEQ